jgi:hypothetical protein
LRQLPVADRYRRPALPTLGPAPSQDNPGAKVPTPAQSAAKRHAAAKPSAKPSGVPKPSARKKPPAKNKGALLNILKKAPLKPIAKKRKAG